MAVPFAVCTVCTHGVVTDCRRAPRCRLCGGDLRRAEPPADLLTGWRCGCFQCHSGPC